MQIPGYHIIRKINQGGMSTVYLAIQLSVGREVALKVMSPALTADPVFSERFQREANIVGQLSHPHIVSLYDIGRYKSLNYIAMDYLAGGSVHDRMASGLSTQEALRVTREVALALDHAHEKGYIHRDIKPENILFREDNSAVLSDFGVAKTVSKASKMTHAGTVVGTPHYMSPEQARGKALDGRSDIYSLGVVFFEMLTGSVPYTADEAVAIAIKHLTAPIPRLPPQHRLFQKILDRLLAKDADDRFQRGREVAEAIEELEKQLLGAPPHYLSTRDPTNLQVMSLLRVLLVTSCAAIALRVSQVWRILRSWRWTPAKGLHRLERPITDIRTQVDTAEEHRVTLISPRAQETARYPQTRSGPRYLSRSLAVLVVAGIVWTAFSIALERFRLPGEEHLPKLMRQAAAATAMFVRYRSASVDGFDSGAAVAPLAQVSASPPPGGAQAAAATGSQAPNGDTPTPVQGGEVEAAAPPPRFALTIHPNPKNARVRILNIREKYFPGIRLLPGRYHIEVTHRGYDAGYEWVSLGHSDLDHEVSLRKTPVPGTSFFHSLDDGTKGPEMVIIPRGSFRMGNKRENSATPVRKIRIAHPFAISKYEVTFADYKKFAEASGHPLPDDRRWGGGSRPVIHVSWYEAQIYAAWLKSATGHNYRLATEAEWEYAARAGTATAYWWGEGDAEGKANCRRGCDSEFSGLFLARTAPVGSYAANGFGLYDTAGNVAEWVADCYQNHYLGAPRNGAAVEIADCSARVVRGGSFRDSSRELYSHRRQGKAPDTREEDIGFRVVVELY